jgi:aspartate racemase
MHKVADTIQSRIGIPLLHITDATAAEVRRAGIQSVGLLGTRFTMEEDFYRGRLTSRFGLKAVVPEAEGRETVHLIIYQELCLGVIRPESKGNVVRIMNRLVEQGAEGIILGCTELGLLLKSEDIPVPLFDTTRLHALAAVEQALQT